MAYQALYRTYRPSDFHQMAGQKHILRTLGNAVEQNKIAHAYLFSGPRGTGKTSVARILAKAVNCIGEGEKPCNACEHCLAMQSGTHPDIIEIDAASNNGVDEVRELIEKVKYAPISSRLKVYIIDEVHMMSTGAFNALLKTLEEPPSHVVFILATTEPHKILPTIISRCQRYDFTKISNAEIERLIRLVLVQEKITCDEASIALISTLADGGMRDALSILDQCIAYAGQTIDIATINEIYGITTTEEKLKLLQTVADKDTLSMLQRHQAYMDGGIDVKRLAMDLIDLLKESIICDLTKETSLLKILREEEVQTLEKMFIVQQRFAMIEILLDCQEKFRFATSAATYFELALLKMTTWGEEEQTPASRIKAVMPKEITSAAAEATPVSDSKQKEAERKEIDIDEIINLLVLANVEDRKQSEATWLRLPVYFQEENYRTMARWLHDCKIVASNTNFLLVSSKYATQAGLINEESQHQIILSLMQQMFGYPRMVVAISEERRTIAIREFIALRDNNRLPEGKALTLMALPEVQEIAVENEVESRMIEICGNILKIVED